MALNARTSPSAVRTRMPGLLPNLKMTPLFGLSADSLPAVTLAVAGSPPSGGTRYRATGYAMAAAVETKPTVKRASRNERRSKSGARSVAGAAGGAMGNSERIQQPEKSRGAGIRTVPVARRDGPEVVDAWYARR